MAQIGNVPEIKAVKKHLEELKQKGLLTDWILPYEELLTRVTAAIFYLTPSDESHLDEIWKELQRHDGFDYRLNEDKKLSDLKYELSFDKGFVLGKGFIGVEEAEKDPDYQRVWN